nr:MAG: fluoride efflux transporter CrcB [Bacillota bacterium]
MRYLWIAAGAVLGAIARYLIGGWFGTRWPGLFPWGTWVINATGAFALGLLNGLAASRGGLSANLHLAIGVGFLGSYTTFSTWAYETVQLMERGAPGLAGLYVMSSVAAGLVGAWLGLRVTT